MKVEEYLVGMIGVGVSYADREFSEFDSALQSVSIQLAPPRLPRTFQTFTGEVSIKSSPYMDLSAVNSFCWASSAGSIGIYEDSELD